MAGKLAHVMNVDVLADVLKENVSANQVVDVLFHKGIDLANAVTPRVYKNFDEFVSEHLEGKSQLVELEGESTVQKDLVVLHGCPMFDEVKKLYTDGKAPPFHAEIVESYKDQNPGSNALLHPGCIVHQVARQMIVHMIEFEDGTHVNFYQVACRSMGTGKVVYDEHGLEATGLTEADAFKLIDGYACLYVLVKH